MKRIRIVDSHTGGEPTRLVVEGGPDLGEGPLSERLELLRKDHDPFRAAVVNEPRGSDVLVGALLCKPVDSQCIAGVIFFNNVGYLGMCGHGTIGLIATLTHMGRIHPGEHWVETPVGKVRATLHDTGRVTITNVRSYRLIRQVAVDVPGYGKVYGDVAWGGNWFYLVDTPDRALLWKDVDELTAFAWAIRQSLEANGITGSNGAKIDHIELSGPAQQPGVDSRNFVLCPGKAYDRSPCGTGTSAKLACLYEEGKLQPSQIWRQEGILGSVFEGSVAILDRDIYPSITGTAFVTAEADLIFDPRDLFREGIHA